MVPKCKECIMVRRKKLITNDRVYHKCDAKATKGRTVCLGDNFPKTSPRWCPLRKAGYSDTTQSSDILKYPNPALIEKLSAKVHDAWWAEKKAQGFHAPMDCPAHIHPNPEEYGKFDKACLNCHPDMYPYEELEENIKDYDRVTVRTVLRAIKKLEEEENE